MSWKSGSEIFSEVIQLLQETIPEYSTRVSVYTDLINIFEDHDCDTLYECLDEDRAFDDAYFNLHPDEENLDEDIEDDDWTNYIDEDS